MTCVVKNNILIPRWIYDKISTGADGDASCFRWFMAVKVKEREPFLELVQESYFKRLAHSSVVDVIINLVSKVPFFGLIPFRDVAAFVVIGADELRAKMHRSDKTEKIATKVLFNPPLINGDDVDSAS